MISEATKKNWLRLKTNSQNRLTSRANKTSSKKRILPLEYFSNLENQNFIEDLLNKIDENSWNIQSVLFSIGINRFKTLGIFEKNHIQQFLKEYNLEVISEIAENKDGNFKIPTDEKDLFGLVYQSFLCEGKKNQMGSYYTPNSITENMLSDVNLENKTFFDPCCGSGAFLLSAKTEKPQSLFGTDSDSIAVMNAKMNLLCKYFDKEFSPNIKCTDFLKNGNPFNQKFDFLYTNPAWGGICEKIDLNYEIKSGETFSYFFVKSFYELNENGKIKFLFPESILNVKVHKDIRKFILEKTKLESITIYDKNFSGVTTSCVDILCQNSQKSDSFFHISENKKSEIKIDDIYGTENLVFNFLNNTDLEIIKKVKKIGKHNLKNSDWALGIVTGDNKNKVLKNQIQNSEKIYTGKEIEAYKLKPHKNFIVYDRKKFQQVASDSFYRANEKLVYKFISKKLVFAYDNSKSLFLNSANILIPKIPTLSVKTVMAFLNSKLFQFFYIKQFGEIKILKGNLCELLFPELSKEDDSEIVSFVDEILNGKTEFVSKIEEKIFNIFTISEEERKYITEVLNGNS